MGGMNITLVINGDKKLTIDTTVQMEDSGQFEAGRSDISAKLSDLLSEAERGWEINSFDGVVHGSIKENRKTKIRWTLWLLLTALCLGGCSLIAKSEQRNAKLQRVSNQAFLKIY